MSCSANLRVEEENAKQSDLRIGPLRFPFCLAGGLHSSFLLGLCRSCCRTLASGRMVLCACGAGQPLCLLVDVCPVLPLDLIMWYSLCSLLL